MRADFGPAMNWYRSTIHGLNQEDEQSALAANDIDATLHLPVFMIAASRDPIAGGTTAVERMRAAVENLKVETLPTGHWVQLERAEEVNALLEGFVMGVEREEGEG
jgi:pimeloyl-ACP methyl ester carboxylesterase